MTKFDDFQRTAEAEVQKGRDQGSLEPLWQLTQALPPEERVVYRLILNPFGHPDDSKHLKAEFDVSERTRISACRLALLAMYFDSTMPRWSSWLLNSVISGVRSIPNGSSCDLFKAMWQFISEDSLLLTRGLAQFTKTTVRNILSRHPTPSELDLLWLLPWPELLTPAQAYFIFNVLALRPELFTKEIEQKIESSLRGTDFHNEVLPVS